MLGLLTLGQGTRPDFEAAMHAVLPRMPYKLTGALDGLDHEALTVLADKNGEYPLRVPACGRAWDIPRARLLPYLCAADSRLRDAGARYTVLMCAGDFPMLPVRGTIIYPGRVTPALLRGLLALPTKPRVGIVLPNAAQTPFAAAHWQREGFTVLTAWAPPEALDRVTTAALDLANAVDAVVLDCMGFGEAHVNAVRAHTSVPVLGALHATLHAIAAFL